MRAPDFKPGDGAHYSVGPEAYPMTITGRRGVKVWAKLDRVYLAEGHAPLFGFDAGAAPPLCFRMSRGRWLGVGFHHGELREGRQYIVADAT